LCTLDRRYIHVVLVASFSNRLDTHTHTKPRSVLLAYSRSADGQCFGCSMRRSGAVHFAFTMFRNLTQMWRYSPYLWSVRIFSRRIAAPAWAPRDVSVTVGMKQCIYIETRNVSGRSVTAVSAVPYGMPHWYRSVCAVMLCADSAITGPTSFHKCATCLN
jgi:hypothetical protein